MGVEMTHSDKKPLSRIAFYITLLALLASLIIIIWLAVLASRHEVLDWEISLFQTIYNWPAWLFPFFLIFTQFGNALIIPIALAGAAVHRHLRLGANIFTTGTLTYLLLIITKEMIARPRPALLLSGIGSRETMLYGYGFPSGHSAISVALALCILPEIPKRYRWIPLAWVVLVPLSRIYLAAHVPTDVIGGLALGIIAYCIVRLSDVISTPFRTQVKSAKRA